MYPAPRRQRKGIVGASLQLEWMNPFGSIEDDRAPFLLQGMAERGDPEDVQAHDEKPADDVKRHARQAPRAGVAVEAPTAALSTPRA